MCLRPEVGVTSVFNDGLESRPQSLSIYFERCDNYPKDYKPYVTCAGEEAINSLTENLAVDVFESRTKIDYSQ